MSTQLQQIFLIFFGVLLSSMQYLQSAPPPNVESYSFLSWGGNLPFILFKLLKFWTNNLHLSLINSLIRRFNVTLHYYHIYFIYYTYMMKWCVNLWSPSSHWRKTWESYSRSRLPLFIFLFLNQQDITVTTCLNQNQNKQSFKLNLSSFSNLVQAADGRWRKNTWCANLEGRVG